MSKRLPVFIFLRHFWLALFLLGAVLGHGEQAKAGPPPKKPNAHLAIGARLGFPQVTAPKKTHQKLTSSRGKGKQKVTTEARAGFFHITLKQADLIPAFLPFYVPLKEVIPAYASRAPGRSFVARIAPLIIQANAP
ncbi:hypothetical protein ACD591_13555 [Rufibacter glacialis]|uniref:Uncharacterized protein n=1 Tax=Rufibacter glacialis TaxID=1259555 RepID=A0A5M8Q5J3_9BACT|nr:hypothetical protein [Rufibacter glacialis]KAA6431119.1 hypothetical protein FOE74_18670 [Rufibacter glacialis]GGK84202.1 hypothetical protein GCM10011405_35130 [Rufibacter glacialis]